MECYASCPSTFEAALADELRALGMRRVRPLTGRVSFEGDVADGLRACLWSRLASRVFAVIDRFDCADERALYEGAVDLPWEDLIAPGASIAVAATGTTAKLRNTHFSAVRMKDAICDRLTEARHARPHVDTRHPDARIALTIRGDRATVAFDLAGEPLFKRFPRSVLAHLARPHAHVLRPDYAALVLAQAPWPDVSAARPALVDVSCAGGGILLEAVQQLRDEAPGLARTRWGFTAWGAFEADAWARLLVEATARADAGARRRGALIGCDLDPAARADAEALLAAAGCADAVTFTAPDAAAIRQALVAQGASRPDAGLVVADALDVPLARVPALAALITELRATDALSALPLVTLAPDGTLEQALGIAPDRARSVRADDETATLARYAARTNADGITSEHDARGRADTDASADSVSMTGSGTTIDVGDGRPLPVLLPESEQFAHRLRKMARLRRRWAQRAGVTCYRVYDADLPDYAASIDLYTGAPATPGRWLVIAEYAAPKTVDADRARARMLDILAIAPRILDVDPACVHARVRTRARGGSQYGRRTERRAETAPTDRALPQIEEGGLTFLVNFDDYLDTGIFLDHRVTRDLVRAHAREARSFLNLFAYTGTATCYAADGGVTSTTTVDLSNTYLAWAERNMRLNGFTGPGHRFVRADVLAWIHEQQRRRERWDLIFCDPPTFSNSAKMGARTFDVQRDHVELLDAVARLLTPGGHAIFSCNLRSFKPDYAALEDAGVELEDISDETIPEDFARTKRIHRCYLVRRAR